MPTQTQNLTQSASETFSTNEDEISQTDGESEHIEGEQTHIDEVSEPVDHNVTANGYLDTAPNTQTIFPNQPRSGPQTTPSPLDTLLRVALEVEQQSSNSEDMHTPLSQLLRTKLRRT